MKFSKSVDSRYLSNLSQQIQVLPSDEASALLFEGSTLILLAGYFDIAYQLFIKLISGELAISEESSLAPPLKSIIPGLCSSMGIPCPAVFSLRELSLTNHISYSKVRVRTNKSFDIFGFLLDLQIKKWWESSNSLRSVLYYFGYFPNAVKRLETGVLRDYIKITQTQAQEFVDSINQRKCEPKIISFIPTVEDWHNFLYKWDTRIFDSLDNAHENNYKDWFPEVLERQSCLNQGATEKEINTLEEKLNTKLPLSYKNFLRASNGFTILDEYCELYGTDEIKWFVEENRESAEIWDDGYDVSDEEYFLYGQHQECGSIRGRYMKTALQISSAEDGYVYLLNPQIIDSRNEWEAWDFGTKISGAYRYRSFWDMMQSVYKRCFD
ncbi:MAG: SMI1/KNR4 family protein [Cyanobacteriota bacterium]|nr:SMI1/KNR4 family protein [Cyanobacteriota bacterium]